MSLLFLIFFSAALVDIAFQLAWFSPYFKYGLPLVKINGVYDFGTLNLESKKYTLKKIAENVYLIRQCNFWGRTSFHHGYVTTQEMNGKIAVEFSIFVDWNVLLAGGFLGCAFGENNYPQYILGAVLAYLLARILMSSNITSIKNLFMEDKPIDCDEIQAKP